MIFHKIFGLLIFLAKTDKTLMADLESLLGDLFPAKLGNGLRFLVLLLLDVLFLEGRPELDMAGEVKVGYKRSFPRLTQS